MKIAIAKTNYRKMKKILTSISTSMDLRLRI